MDLNKLLYDHQIALMQVMLVSPAIAQDDLVDHYEGLLQKARHKQGVEQHPLASIQEMLRSLPFYPERGI